MQEFSFEWASKVDRRGGRMLPVSLMSSMECLGDPGFRSVYLFNAKDAELIKESGSSAGFANYETTSECLFIDLDDGDIQLPQLESKLQELGLGYEVWASGGKGYHFHIRQKLVTGFDVPYSQKVFVDNLGIKYDPSIYQPNSLIALPNRKHPRTGKRKSKVKTVEGNELMLELKETPKNHFSYTVIEESSESQKVLALSMLVGLVKEPDTGKRHITLWRTAKTMAAAGFSYDFTVSAVMEITASWKNQKSQEETLKPLKAAYRQPK